MTKFDSERRFQLWEYRVGHGSLLIRSPRDDEFRTNVDLAFAGVEYVSLPRHMDGVQVASADKADVSALERVLGRTVDPKNVIVLLSGGSRFMVLAAGVNVSENEMDIFDSPFD